MWFIDVDVSQKRSILRVIYEYKHSNIKRLWKWYYGNRMGGAQINLVPIIKFKAKENFLRRLGHEVLGNCVYQYLDKEDRVRLSRVSKSFFVWDEHLTRKALMFRANGADATYLMKLLLNEEKLYDKETLKHSNQEIMGKHRFLMYTEEQHLVWENNNIQQILFHEDFMVFYRYKSTEENNKKAKKKKEKTRTWKFCDILEILRKNKTKRFIGFEIDRKQTIWFQGEKLFVEVKSNTINLFVLFFLNISKISQNFHVRVFSFFFFAFLLFSSVDL
jgi:hypothetical protein